MAEEKEYFREKSQFRKYLDKVRWVLTGIGVLLIIVVGVVVMSIAIRREKLDVWVPGGIISVEQDDYSTSSPSSLTFNFTLQAANPSGRARIYFVNISATVEVNNASSSTATKILNIGIADIDVVQETTATVIVRANNVSRKLMNAFYFDKLQNNGSIIYDATMLLNGSLVTGVNSIYNRTQNATVYRCSPLNVVDISSLDAGDIDTGDINCIQWPAHAQARAM
ncbi:hypothetical protein ACP4OV_030540 [Aristida adscensionis]